MKALTLGSLTLVLALGIVVGAVAQTSTTPPGGATTQPGNTTTQPGSAPSAQPPSSSSSSSQATTPGTSSSDSSKDVRRDSVDASPRTTTESTRIFGLNPIAAALIAAALLVVVILAIVSMSRGASQTDTHVDVDRRP